MDKDILELIKVLVTRNTINLEAVQKKIKSTARQIQYRLDKVNQILSENNLPIITIDNNKSFIVLDDSKKFMINLVFNNKEDIDYYFNRNERIIYIFLSLFLSEEYVSMFHFKDDLDVSRSTIIQDLKELEKWLENNNIYLKYNRTNGYYIEADELILRSFMIQIIIEYISTHTNYFVFDKLISSKKLKSYKESREIIDKLLEKHGMLFVEKRLDEFVYTFLFLITRMLNEHVNYTISKLDKIKITDFKEYKFITELLSYEAFSHPISNKEKEYLAAWFLGGTVGNFYDNTNDKYIIENIVKSIIDRFEKLSCVKYEDYEEIFIKMYSHFRPAYYRIMFQFPILNALKDQVKKDYSALYGIVNEAIKSVFNLFEKNVSDDEIAYLTMHFSAILSNTTNTIPIVKYKGVIVCLSGIGNSVVLYNQLKNLFPYIDFEIENKGFDDSLMYDKFDIIFTTKYFHSLWELEKPIIYVETILSEKDKIEIQREVMKKLDNAASSSDNLEYKISEVVKRYLKETKQNQQLISDLMFLYKKELNVSSLSFLDMLDPNLIDLNLEIEEVDELIDVVGNKLYENKNIRSVYAKNFSEELKKIPEYYVITPNIALLHSKLKEGVLKPAIALTTLKKAMPFGKKRKPMVKYFFTLVVKDNISHIEAMNQFLTLINNEKFMRFLEQCDSKIDLINRIKKEVE